MTFGIIKFELGLNPVLVTGEGDTDFLGLGITILWLFYLKFGLNVNYFFNMGERDKLFFYY